MKAFEEYVKNVWRFILHLYYIVDVTGVTFVYTTTISVMESTIVPERMMKSTVT